MRPLGNSYGCLYDANEHPCCFSCDICNRFLFMVIALSHCFFQNTYIFQMFGINQMNLFYIFRQIYCYYNRPNRENQANLLSTLNLSSRTVKHLFIIFMLLLLLLGLGELDFLMGLLIFVLCFCEYLLGKNPKCPFCLGPVPILK